ncbi:MAG: SEC-C metal-binding domain-containing protein [bacterium]
MTYQTLSDNDLIGLLFTEEDRLPRAAVDEFVRRGERMIEPLKRIVSERFYWTYDPPEFWAVVHASYILGAISGEKVVVPLLRALRWSVAFDCDWVSDKLTYMFSKIGISAIPELKKLSVDRTSDWFTRSVVMNSLGGITIDNPEVEEDIFSFIGAIFRDESEDWETRQLAANVLLDFLRQEYRDELIKFGKKDTEFCHKDKSHTAMFDEEWARQEFSRGEKDYSEYIDDWLSFYDEDEIKGRQDRWDKEALEDMEDEEETLKIGRNDPCPCGSGKKYKKCCMEN